MQVVDELLVDRRENNCLFDIEEKIEYDRDAISFSPLVWFTF